MLTIQRVIHLLPGAADHQRLADALAIVAPSQSLRVSGGALADLFVLGAESDAALETLVDRLTREHGATAVLGATHGVHDRMLRRTARGVGKYVRYPDGQPGDYALVEIELTKGGHWEPAEIDGQARFLRVPRQFVPAIQSTLRDLLWRTLGPCGLDDVGVALTLGVHHDRESTPEAFAIATARAFRDALAKAGTMRVTSKLRLLVSVPAAHERTVVAELFDRQAEPELRTRVGDRVQLVAKAPLVSLLGFETWLRTTSDGSGTVQLRFAGFQPIDGADADDEDDGAATGVGARLRGPRPCNHFGIALAEPDEELEPVGAGRVMRVGAPS